MRKIKIVCEIVILVVLTLCVTTAVENRAQKRQLEETYARVEALVQGGEYAGALDILEGLDDSYRNVKSLRYYSNARVSYDQGELSDAYGDLFRSVHYCADGEEMPEGYEAFRASVTAEYAVYEQERARQAREAYRERVRTGVPFEGMLEADIANTSLGAPSSRVGHNSEWVDAGLVTTNIYRFYRNGREIFSARCISGIVRQVWDSRDKAALPKTRSSGRSSKEQEDDADPLNAKDYLFPEDFYEDHLDDFYDFYDAEDYYYEHGGS